MGGSGRSSVPENNAVSIGRTPSGGRPIRFFRVKYAYMEKNLPAHETEPTPEPLDREAILNALAEIIGAGELELGVDLDNRDELEQLLGDDDEELISNLVSLAAENGIDIEEFLVRLGIPVERIVDPSQ